MKFYSKTNRIDDAIERQRARINTLIDSGVDLQGNPIAPSLERMHTVMALTTRDHGDYQKCQSTAAHMDRINVDESLTIRNALGGAHNHENGGWENGVDLATKIIITQMIKELTRGKISEMTRC